ncbi:MAG: TadE/TadG family type IV pilus assembly protein [Candidatus Limnocylindrales bacterium]|jgi:hypothetical protein
MQPLGRSQRLSRLQRGQALVEFALIIPTFLVLVVAIIEFSFLLTAKIGVTDTSQDAVRYAAELGNTVDADFDILQLVESEMGPPINKAHIASVSIFWTDKDGDNLGAADTYTRGGQFWNSAGTASVPYQQITSGYPVSSRCNVLGGIGCATGHTGVDWIGVTITYNYSWVTPLPNLVPGLGTAALQFVQTSTSRLEPVL